MAVADFAREWFESEPLCATVAAGGVLGSFLGVRSAGSTAILLLLAASEGQPIAPGWSVRGGIGAVSDALAKAAREAGAEIRLLSEVERILVKDGVATGVVLASGEEIPAKLVVSNADPRRTLLGLVDRVHLSPEFVRRVQNIRMRGALAKINYAVTSLPAIAGVGPDPEAALSGCVRLATNLDAIERAFDAAKYGRIADEPWMELAIPSIADPALAPEGQHVVSAYLQFAPYNLSGTGWDAERDRLGDVATRTIAKYAPGFERSILGAGSRDATRSRAALWLDRWPHLSRRARARPDVRGPSAARLGAASDAHSQPVLVRIRNAPGDRPRRPFGSAGRHGDLEGL